MIKAKLFALLLLLAAGVLTPCFFPEQSWAAKSGKSTQKAQNPKQNEQEADRQTMLQADKLYQENKFAEAAKLMTPLARKNHPAAAFALGLMEARGNLGPADYIKARHWWEKSAQSGHPEAEYNLGLIYYRGVHNGGDGSDFSKRDYAGAMQWLAKAAAHGHGGAMYALAGMARTGEGQAKDPAKAAAWYLKAAEAGHPDAQYQLATLYLNGAGVPQDAAQAKFWMQKAANVGHPGAIQAMKFFKK